MRLINADSVVAELKDQHDYIMQDPEVSKTMKWCEAVCFNRTIETLDCTPTFIPAPEWISVDDRMPEDTLGPGSKKKQIKVLTAIKAKNGCTVRSQLRMKHENWYSGDVKWSWKYSAGEVTHWMPLPEPPGENDRK